MRIDSPVRSTLCDYRGVIHTQKISVIHYCVTSVRILGAWRIAGVSKGQAKLEFRADVLLGNNHQDIHLCMPGILKQI